MHYAEFAEDEVSSFVRLSARLFGRVDVLTVSQSAALLQAIKDYENNKWKAIGARVGKPAKVRLIYPRISQPCNATVLRDSFQRPRITNIQQACEQFAKEQGWKV